ncbi:MAG TPA: MFS transporter, partial [Phycisphaerae bacterium]
MLFFITTLNNADRATLNAAGPSMSKDLGLDPVQLGIVLSAFGWSYVVAQLPGGWLLDRFGSYRVYTWCIGLWSIFTLLQGFVGFFSAGIAIVVLFILRFFVGFAEAPSFPANGRIVASWFPTKERGTASAIFNSAQYFATVLFAPLMGMIIYYLGWKNVFWVMGGLGLAMILPWIKLVRSPMEHPLMSGRELESIEKGGALVEMDERREVAAGAPAFKWDAVKQLLASRMMIGIYLGQY